MSAWQRCPRPRAAAAASWLLVLLLAALSGCKDDTIAAAPSASSNASSPPPATSSASASPYADADLHVAEDFAAEADKAISKDNYKDKLADMTRELERKPAAADDVTPAASSSAGASPDGTAAGSGGN